tara:strand:+ start:367 stop:567 length:201 start_codon:yes stop_codon:yes gene_type:complete
MEQSLILNTEIILEQKQKADKPKPPTMSMEMATIKTCIGHVTHKTYIKPTDYFKVECGQSFRIIKI